MKLGIVIYSTDAEALWNGFRLGVFALKAGDQVKAFLFARGVECESHTAEPFNVKQMMQSFVDEGGEIMTCGTCLSGNYRPALNSPQLNEFYDQLRLLHADLNEHIQSENTFLFPKINELKAKE